MNLRKVDSFLGASHLQKYFLTGMALLFLFAALKFRGCIIDDPDSKQQDSFFAFGNQCEFERTIERSDLNAVSSDASYPRFKPKRKQVDDFDTPSADLYNAVWTTIYPNRSTKCWSCRFGPDVAFKLKAKSVLDAGAGEI